MSVNICLQCVFNHLATRNRQVEEEEACTTRCNISLLTAVAAVAAADCLSVAKHLYFELPAA